MATSSDYIPRADGDFNAWLQNLVSNVTTNTAALGLTSAEITPVEEATTDWNNKYAANITAQSAAQSARQAKDDARTATESVVRPLVSRLQASTTVTDAQRQSLSITVRSTTRTLTGAPTSKPVAQVDTSQRPQAPPISSIWRPIHARPIWWSSTRRMPERLLTTCCAG